MRAIRHFVRSWLLGRVRLRELRTDCMWKLRAAGHALLYGGEPFRPAWVRSQRQFERVLRLERGLPWFAGGTEPRRLNYESRL